MDHPPDPLPPSTAARVACLLLEAVWLAMFVVMAIASLVVFVVVQVVLMAGFAVWDWGREAWGWLKGREYGGGLAVDGEGE